MIGEEVSIRVGYDPHHDKNGDLNDEGQEELFAVTLDLLVQDVLDAVVVALWLILGRLKAQLFDLLDDVAKGQTVGAPSYRD